MPCSAAALACCFRHLLLSTATLSVFLGRPRRRYPVAARGLRSPPVLSLLARLRVALLRQQEQGHAKAKGCALLMSNQGTRPGKQGRAAQTFVSLVRREGALCWHGTAWHGSAPRLGLFLALTAVMFAAQRLAAWLAWHAAIESLLSLLLLTWRRILARGLQGGDHIRVQQNERQQAKGLCDVMAWPQAPQAIVASHEP